VSAVLHNSSPKSEPPLPRRANADRNNAAILGDSLTAAQSSWGLWRIAARRLWRSRQGRIGLVIVCMMILAAIFAPLLAPYSPLELAPRDQFQAPSWRHPFGTDEFGRDLLSRVIYGSRVSLIGGGGAVVLAGLLGITLGMTAGYVRGRTETILTRFFDLVLAFPAILLAIGAIAVLGRSTQSAIIAIGLVNMASFARLTRASVLAEAE
jgi:peptide/nickel transport system permease protein